MKPRPYRCPGCDQEAYVFVTRTTLHSFGKNGLVEVRPAVRLYKSKAKKVSAAAK